MNEATIKFGSESQGSTRERALKMEIADDEAKKIVTEQQGSEKFWNKLKNIFNRREQGTAQLTVQEKLDDEIVDRVASYAINNRIDHSSDYKELTTAVVNPEAWLNPDQMKTLAPDLRQKVLIKVADAATERKAALCQYVVKDFQLQFDNATSLDELGQVMGVLAEDLLKRNTSQDQYERVYNSLRINVDAYAQKKYKIDSLYLGKVQTDIWNLATRKIGKLEQAAKVR